MIGVMRALIARDLQLAARVGGSGALSLVFFLMIVALVPFALGPDLNLLSRIGPAILWLAAVLATLIGLDRLFQADEEDGSLDLMTGAPAPMEMVVPRQGDCPLAHHRPAVGSRFAALRAARRPRRHRHGRHRPHFAGGDAGPDLHWRRAAPRSPRRSAGAA